MSEETFHFSVYFQGVESKYLNDIGSGCNRHRTHEPRGVLNSLLCLERTDSDG